MFSILSNTSVIVKFREHDLYVDIKGTKDHENHPHVLKTFMIV